MNKWFYPKLAMNNIKKNGQTYIPYLITCIITVSMYYIMQSLSLNDGLDTMRGGYVMVEILEFGCWIIGIFSVIFLFYTNSFLMKRRKKEIGLLNILGMEKRHILKVIGLETFYIAGISLSVGLLLGILLEKVMYLVLMKILDFEITLGFHIYGKALLSSFILFVVIFIMIFLNSLRQVSLSKPIELLQGGAVGEKEPKTKWMIAVLGAACLAGGYTLSIVTKNPVQALLVFFLAVILVIFGTYFLFVAGSIAVLKLLRRNKRYYYQTRHFTTVSGMLYRMKRNAVGLANICILSTMVLVMISTTVSLMVGEEDIINQRVPYDICVRIRGQADANPDIETAINEEIAKQQLEIENEIQYTYFEFAGIPDGSRFLTEAEAFDSAMAINYLIFIPVSDYNRITNNNIELEQDEVLLYSNRETYEFDTLEVYGKNFRIKEHLNDFFRAYSGETTFGSYYIIVKDMAVIGDLYEQEKAEFDNSSALISYFYGYDLIGTDEGKLEAYNQMQNRLLNDGWNAYAKCKIAQKENFLELYGSLLFLGIFLGLLFIMATILIIYYKQISEGYEDQNRFEIMQKVGMSHEEVKQSIHSQILTVFFLPLLTAGTHVVFAFPVISRMLLMFGLTNTKLYILCTAVCFLAFGILYGVIYSITAKAYYNIVSRN